MRILTCQQLSSWCCNQPRILPKSYQLEPCEVLLPPDELLVLWPQRRNEIVHVHDHVHDGVHDLGKRVLAPWNNETIVEVETDGGQNNQDKLTVIF